MHTNRALGPLTPDTPQWHRYAARMTAYRLALIESPPDADFGPVLLVAIGRVVRCAALPPRRSYLEARWLAREAKILLGDAETILPWLASQGWVTAASLSEPEPAATTLHAPPPLVRVPRSPRGLGTPDDLLREAARLRETQARERPALDLDTEVRR